MLQVRVFVGKIAEDKETKRPEIQYDYSRIVLPWSRSGKDKDGNEVDGAVASLSEVMAYLQAEGFPAEFKVTKDAEEKETADGPSIVGFLIDGINAYKNRTARVQAENTPESAVDKAVQLFMSKTGYTREKALEFLGAAFGAK